MADLCSQDRDNYNVLIYFAFQKFDNVSETEYSQLSASSWDKGNKRPSDSRYGDRHGDTWAKPADPSDRVYSGTVQYPTTSPDYSGGFHDYDERNKQHSGDHRGTSTPRPVSPPRRASPPRERSPYRETAKYDDHGRRGHSPPAVRQADYHETKSRNTGHRNRSHHHQKSPHDHRGQVHQSQSAQHQLQRGERIVEAYKVTPPPPHRGRERSRERRSPGRKRKKGFRGRHSRSSSSSYSSSSSSGYSEDSRKHKRHRSNRKGILLVFTNVRSFICIDCHYHMKCGLTLRY